MRRKFVALLLIPLLSFSQDWKDYMELYGDIFQIVISLYAFGLTLYKEDKEGALQFLKSYTSAMGITYALKYTLNTRRPNGGKHSFPSGHTASAFAGAGFLHMRYGRVYGAPSYVLASLVGASRVVAKKHWVRDVVGGALIGIGTNMIFTGRYSASVTLSKEGMEIAFDYSW